MNQITVTQRFALEWKYFLMWPNWKYFSEIIQPFYLRENYKTKGARSISTKKLRPFKDFKKILKFHHLDIVIMV